ncbi:hypothetical protein JW752_00090 [Candidatus Peregrinibacteria bacterium]|nr:hypothetical protein [Candidatus Peregrinibacteria bacterium]
MKKTIPILLFTGFLLIFPKMAFAGLSEGCFPAVVCGTGQNYYADDCKPHIETLTGATQSCQSNYDDPPAGKQWAFNCDNGCYGRSDDVAAECPGGIMIAGDCKTLARVVIDGLDNNILKTYALNTLTKLVYADCGDGESPIWDNTAHEWVCVIPAAMDPLAPCADGEVLSWDAGNSEWVCGPPNFTYWSANPADPTEIYYNADNVGIGTTDPAAKLDVNGSMRAGYGLDRTSYFGHAAIGYATYNGYATFAHKDHNTDADAALVQTPGGETYLNTSSGDQISFTIGGTTGTLAMRINSSGNVGMGTTDPDYKLHVENSTIYDSVDPDRFYAVADSREYYGLYAEAKGASGNLGAPPLYYNFGIKGIANESNSHGNFGVWGEAANGAMFGAGVYGKGVADYMYGVIGESEMATGVYGEGADKGVRGVGDNYGVYGHSTSGKGVYGGSSSGYGGYFSGDVYVSDNLEVSDDLMLSEYARHSNDDDTYLQFDTNTLNFVGGGKELFRARGTAQAYAYLGNSSDDIDIALNDDLFVRGSDGNVGIGTLAPDNKLHVEGGYIENSASAPRLIFEETDQSDNLWIMGQDATEFWIAHDSTANENRVIQIEETGEVGIGTADPSAKLDIAVTGDGTEVLRFSTERPWTFRQRGTGSSAILDLWSTVDGKNFTITSAANDNQAALFAPRNTAADSRVYLVQDGGRVGIGTSSPGSVLEVSGDTILDHYVQLRDYDDDTLTTHLIARDDNWMFFSGGVAIGTWSNGGLGAVGTGDLVVEGGASIGTTTETHSLVVASADEETVRLMGPDSYGHGARLNFGDVDYVYFDEYEDDKLKIYGEDGIYIDTHFTSDYLTIDTNVDALYDIYVGDELTVDNDLWVDDDIYLYDKIYHKGDEDTYIDFNTDNIDFYAEGVNTLDLRDDIVYWQAGGKMTACPDGYTLVDWDGVNYNPGFCIKDYGDIFIGSWPFANAACMAEGAHMCDYTELWLAYEHGSPCIDINGYWINEYVDDDDVLCGNKTISSCSDSDIPNFEGNCAAHSGSRSWTCCISANR